MKRQLAVVRGIVPSSNHLSSTKDDYSTSKYWCYLWIELD